MECVQNTDVLVIVMWTAWFVSHALWTVDYRCFVGNPGDYIVLTAWLDTNLLQLCESPKYYSSTCVC